jgi:hypothetical protein
MKKQLTVEEKVKVLTEAIWRADGKLEWILNPDGKRKASEWAMTTAKHVRGILRRALRKVEADEAPVPAKETPHVDR